MSPRHNGGVRRGVFSPKMRARLLNERPSDRETASRVGRATAPPVAPGPAVWARPPALDCSHLGHNGHGGRDTGVLTREELAALVNDRGRLRTGRARAGSPQLKLVVSLSPLTLTEARAVIATVPGATLRRPDEMMTTYQVDVRSHAATALFDGIVDLLTDARQSRLSAALDEIDESTTVAHRTSSGGRGDDSRSPRGRSIGGRTGGPRPPIPASPNHFPKVRMEDPPAALVRVEPRPPPPRTSVLTPFVKRDRSFPFVNLECLATSANLGGRRVEN